MRLSVFAVAAVVFICTLSGWLTARAGQCSPADKAINFNAEWRLRYEDRACIDFCSRNQKNPRDEHSRLRLNFSATASPSTQWVARLQHSYTRNSLQGSADSQERSGFQQLYVDTSWGRLSLRLGRQDLNFGDGRLLSTLNWSNIAASWDALRLSASHGYWNAHLIYGRPGMFPTSTTHPVLYGIYATYRPSSRWQSDVYLLRKEVIASGTQQRIWAVGARPVVQLNKEAKLTAEVVLQSGEVGAKSLGSWGYWARLEYTLSRPSHTKLILQRDFASGGNPDDTNLRTFDQFFGTTFGMCGRMGLQGWRNMSAWRIGVSGSPSPRWGYTADIHLNRLADARDYWYGGSGSPVKGAGGKSLRDPTGSAGAEVGTEVNLTLNYSLSRELQLSAGYGRFIPGRFVRETNSGFADRTEWFYLQTTRKF
jgi:hypothetical protein